MPSRISATRVVCAGPYTRRPATRADTHPHPRIARAYRALLLDEGSQDVEVEVHTMVVTAATMLPILSGHVTAAREAGVISDDQAENWLGEQARRARDGRLLIAVPMFLASATR